MPLTVTVELTEAQDKAFKYIAMDPGQWINLAVEHRISLIEEKLYNEAVEEAVANPEVDSLPTNKRDIAIQKAGDMFGGVGISANNGGAGGSLYADEDLDPDSPFIT